MADFSDEQRKEVAERAARNWRRPGVPLNWRAVVRADGGFQVVLVHHKGAKSGVERVNPVAYLEAGDNIAIFASNGGRNKNPDWYYNLVAHPDTFVELGTETFPVRARVASGQERAEIWEAQKADVADVCRIRENDTARDPSRHTRAHLNRGGRLEGYPKSPSS